MSAERSTPSEVGDRLAKGCRESPFEDLQLDGFSCRIVRGHPPCARLRWGSRTSTGNLPRAVKLIDGDHRLSGDLCIRDSTATCRREGGQWQP